MSDLTCNKAGPDCEGGIHLWDRPSDGAVWPKCSYHYNEAVHEFARIDSLYGVTSDVSPAGFDPTDCGEVWDDE